MARFYHYLAPPLAGVLITLSPPRSLVGVCERVFDGDTLQVAGEVIRLAHVDAPEWDQRSRWGVPVGRQSAQFLADLVLHRWVQVNLLHRGFYGRWVGRVFLLEGGEEVNLQLVRQGHAFAASFRQKTLGIFLWSQSVARAKGLGLWHYRGVQYPWSYRRRQKKTPRHQGGEGDGVK